MTSPKTLHKPSFEVLYQLERDLNKHKFQGVALGGLLAYPFGCVYRGSYHPSWKKILLILKLFGKSFSKKKKFFTDKSIFYYQSFDFNHYRKLYGVIANGYLKPGYFIYGNTSTSMIKRDRTFVIPFYASIKVQLWFLANLLPLFRRIRKAGFSTKASLSLLCDLNMQCIRCVFWNLFFQRSKNLKVLVGDYDRGHEPSVIFSCAKKYGIKTVVLQHGVVNPAYAFTPLIADKVCVWGEMQRLQLKELGANDDQIVVTGTPIIETIKKSTELRKEILKKHGIDRGKANIVLAVNPIKEDYNRKLIETLEKACEYLGIHRFNFWIKLHPAQNSSQYKWVEERSNIKLMDKSITPDEFFNICDLLVTHNSGIATEALYYQIPVGILDILPLSIGNCFELHKHLQVPLIKDSMELADFILSATIAKSYNTGQSGIQKIYYKTGTEAATEIVGEINKYL